MNRVLQRINASLVWSMTLLLICSTCIVWLLFTAVLVRQTERMTHDVLVRQHRQFADMLWGNLHDRDDLQLAHIHPLGSQGGLEFALYSAQGTLLNTSSRPPLPFQPQASNDPRILRLAGQDMLLSSRGDDSYQLVVASPDNSAKLLSHELADHVALLALAGLLLLIPVLYWALKRGLRPLYRFSDEVATRAADNLSPLQTPVKAEFAPLKTRLNALFAQVDQTLSREKRFTADAAHELRTPLAAIRLHLELAQNSQRAEVRERALARATTAVDRTTHVVSQLLLLARLEHGQSIERAPIDFAELAKQALEDAGLPADPAHLNIVEAPRLNGQAVLWAMVMRNLIDNAQRYGGENTEVFVTLKANEITLYDTGCGIAPDQLPRLGERFYRANQAREGAGLGWSIILNVARLHQVSLTPFAVVPHGLGIRFTLPR
jgi:two-component system sensor histidine kinase QseC